MVGPSECGVSLVLECDDWLTFCYPWKIPQTPRLTTIPLPPVTSCDDTWGPGGFYDGCGDDDDDDRGDGDFLAQEAEMSRSLATAKPEYIENDARSRVSFLFTPPETVLYTDGFDNSQAAQPPQVRGAVTTGLGMPGRRSCASPRSARCWESLQQIANSSHFRQVRQFVRMGRSGVNF